MLGSKACPDQGYVGGSNVLIDINIMHPLFLPTLLIHKLINIIAISYIIIIVTHLCVVP